MTTRDYQFEAKCPFCGKGIVIALPNALVADTPELKKALWEAFIAESGEPTATSHFDSCTG